MSENVIAALLSFGLLGGMFLWVPLLEAVCPPCGRFLRSRRKVVSEPAVPEPVEVARVA